MTISELVREFWQSGKERLKNPIIGAFLISWSVLNYDILILFFSSVEPLARIALIQQHVSFEKTTLYPLIVALVVRLVLPYLSLFQDQIVEFARLKRGQLSEKWDEERRRKSKEEASHQYEVAMLKSGEREANQLRKQMEALELQKADLTNDLNKVTNELEEANRRLDINRIEKQFAQRVIQSYFEKMAIYSAYDIDEYSMPKVDGTLDHVESFFERNHTSEDKGIIQQLLRLEEEKLDDIPDRLFNLLDEGLSVFVNEPIGNSGRKSLSEAGKSLYYTLKARELNKSFVPRLY
ncbi:hypothetical protein [Croceimicrobium hydrocarbonivorans]|uniref:Uncharacterized protein n=1 Tax=Croceimicrobium hydrocarbonivorans TaxID=2761580 RepID=A0A7H0VD44_9FLAO|nr:hypothetical protein [Croceimicrobium hydrocarbonivorans]QNR23642.1 hypothetical protein H4K34_14845 [Croceimicrobium hydrocarbonivorans]